jgi:predicted patatin/cPLA2 family phospholipase
MKEKELRIALVCYGGVSLGLYMQGVIKEFLKLIRASKAGSSGNRAVVEATRQYWMPTGFKPRS